MSIRKNILKVKQRMFTEIDSNGDRPFCNEVQTKALAAIRAGQGSDAWGVYMSLFVDDGHPEQLARLMAKDGTDQNDGLNEKRAYLAADGTCTTETVTNFGVNASEGLDANLPVV
jgi:hypothetical protein